MEKIVSDVIKIIKGSKNEKARPTLEISYGSACGNEKRENWWLYSQQYSHRSLKIHFPHLIRCSTIL